MRVLARTLAHEADLSFGRGLDHTDEPALWSHDDSGQLRLWVDVGAPTAQRLHRASKQAERVMVFTDKNLLGLKKEWRGERIHRAEEIHVVLFGSHFIAALAAGIQKQNPWNVTIHDGQLTVGFGDESVTCELQTTNVAAILRTE